MTDSTKTPATKAAAKKTAAKKTAAKKTATGDKGTFTAEERAAMKQAAAERKRTAKGENAEADVLAAIDAMDTLDKKIATGLHRLVKEAVPELGCRTWYGFPAYTRGDKIMFHYAFAGKFKSRYGSLAFSDNATGLDDGTMWPTSFALLDWNDDIAAQVRPLIEKAVG